MNILDGLDKNTTVCLELNVRSAGVFDYQSLIVWSIIERKLVSTGSDKWLRILILLFIILNFRSSHQ
jgi:hypothetical protein